MLRFSIARFNNNTANASSSSAANSSVFSSLLENFYSPTTTKIRVKNTQSTARDHLANERTFLAFARTGMSFLAAALGLFSSYTFGFDPKNEASVHPKEIVPAVAGLALNGVGILFYAMSRFLHVQQALETGEFIIAKKRFVLLVAMTGIVTTWSLSQIYLLEMRKKGVYK